MHTSIGVKGWNIFKVVFDTLGGINTLKIALIARITVKFVCSVILAVCHNTGACRYTWNYLFK